MATDNDELSRVRIDDKPPSHGKTDEELLGEWFFIEYGEVFVKLTSFDGERVRFHDQSDNEYVLPRSMLGGPVRMQVGTPD